MNKSKQNEDFEKEELKSIMQSKYKLPENCEIIISRKGFDDVGEEPIILEK